MCHVSCVMHDVLVLIFCKILTLLVKGRPTITNLGDIDLLSDIPKLIPGGSRIYAISCKASYPFCYYQHFVEWLTIELFTDKCRQKTVVVCIQLVPLPHTFTI